VRRRHPWIFSGAVDGVEGDAAAGDTVEVRSAEGEAMGRASYSPNSQIRARMWTFADEVIDFEFLRRRVRLAIDQRAQLGFRLPGDTRQPRVETDAFRLIFAESDGLPGFIADVYHDTLVMQCLAAGAEFWRNGLAEALAQETGLRQLLERSDADVRELEGLLPRAGPAGEGVASSVVISEHGLHFKVDLEHGQKTGFYLDQCNNRKRLRDLAKGRRVLDCFCYTGGFTLNALRGEAESVLAVDSSASALALAGENVALNGFSEARVEFREADVFEFLRRLRDQGRTVDLVILDPPKFAPTAAHADKAARAYKDINLLAFKLLAPGGILVTFSCSGGVDRQLFQKIVAAAALDAGVDAQIVEQLSQGADHPIALQFPESSYLKGLICMRQ
jgi:23S rRNA (cytosine1962-C5)-methyltransferase